MRHMQAIITLLSAGLLLIAVAGMSDTASSASIAAGADVSSKTQGLERINYRSPGITHRPRWRTQCWTVRRTIRQWDGHRWVKKVVRTRTCRLVRVW